MLVFLQLHFSKWEEIFYLNIYGDFVTVVYVRHTEFSPIQVACSLRRLASTNWGQSLLLMLHIYPILQLFSTTRQEELLILSLYRTKKYKNGLITQLLYIVLRTTRKEDQNICCTK